MARIEAGVMTNPIKDAAKQMDDWAARQEQSGITGSVRIQGQIIGDGKNVVTAVHERPIGYEYEKNPAPLSKRVLLAADRWLAAKLELQQAEADLEDAVRKLRGY